MTDRPDFEITLQAQHARELAAAVHLLERPTFAARLADYAGQPVNQLIKLMPRPVNRRVQAIVRAAILQCLEIAVNSLDEDDPLLPPSEWTSKLITGVTGGVGGYFGMLALPIELPLTTTLMLRSIAEIARAHGEDLTTLEGRLSCVEVFAIGGRPLPESSHTDYYAARTMLSRLLQDVVARFVECGALNASSPVITRLVGEIIGRFGVAVSDRLAAGAAPIIGAVGGATINMVFMDHFQRVARGHFSVRRLERIYGPAQIEAAYHAAAQHWRRPTRRTRALRLAAVS